MLKRRLSAEPCQRFDTSKRSEAQHTAGDISPSAHVAVCDILSLLDWKGQRGKHDRCGNFLPAAFLQLCTYRRRVYDDWGRCPLHMRGFTPHTVGRVHVAHYLSVSEAPRWWRDRADVGGGRRRRASKAPKLSAGPPTIKLFLPSLLKVHSQHFEILFRLPLSEERNDPVPASHAGPLVPPPSLLYGRFN